MPRSTPKPAQPRKRRALSSFFLLPSYFRSPLSSFFLFNSYFLLLASCAIKDREHTVRISVADQKLAIYDRNIEVRRYPVSTSKFGLGDTPGSNATPLGHLEIAEKIGAGQPLGMKFKDRKPTGEIVPANAPGRDPIVTRILWLKGLEPQNANAHDRDIYIHGTAEEWRLGTPASYGCIRMRSKDVAALFDTVGRGAQVEITPAPLPPPPPPSVSEPTAAPKRGDAM